MNGAAKTRTLRALFEATAVAVIREGDPRRAETIASGLLEGGMTALEITTSTPRCFDIVRKLADAFPQAVLGIGTVRRTEHVDQAVEASARYVVSPHMDPKLIEAAQAAHLVTIPGAMTPTEVLRAREAGGDIIKVFPVSAVGGVRFLQLLRGPIPDVPLWVSGNLSLTEVPDYLDAGASLVGLTTAVTADLGQDVFAGAKLRAQQVLRILSEAREGRRLLEVTGPKGVVALGLKELRRLPGSEHSTLQAIVPDRRGHVVRVRKVLESAGISGEHVLQIASRDGFTRELGAKELIDGGYLQYALDGHPLSASDGGPLRLYVVGADSQCDNVKALSQISIVSA